ncbi:MAG: type I pantothenate kinase, partial [Microbacteriaceae bacterium]|nr:type I pantothenate kinase [Microbacteriaceae bacterium]
MSEATHSNGHSTPFLEIDRASWAELAPGTEHQLTAKEISDLRGLGDTLNLDEVAEVYLPLSRLINLYAVGA